MAKKTSPVFRFAPSPNGWLHVGHALSALLNADGARRAGGRLLLRIEDIDEVRARPAFVDAIFEDLAWLGLAWETPVRRQSEHLDDYASALATLKARGVVYPCFCSRGDVARALTGREREAGAPWPRDPDGAPLYPGACRGLSATVRARRLAAGDAPAWRLDMSRALELLGGAPSWREAGARAPIRSAPAAWGDIVVARRDIGTSYHLAVVVDDALQGVTHVVRGRDLYHATAIHRVLQELLGLPAPVYAHHRLVLGAAGGKLSKSLKSTALRDLRAAGATPDDIRRMAGLQALRRVAH